MYKLLIQFPLFFLIVFNGIAQNNVRMTLGFNTGSITPSTSTVSFESNTGYQAGIDVQFGKKIYFQPGLYYNVKKNQLNHSSMSVDQSQLSIGSIRVPVFLGYRLSQNPESKLNIYTFTGPSVSILSSIQHTENDALSIGDDELHDVEWTWSIGGGIDYKAFFFELAYEHGLTYTFLTHDAKRKMFIFNFGYKLFF